MTQKKGYKASEATRQKMRLAKLDKSRTEEVKQKMRHPHVIRKPRGPHTEATKQKMRHPHVIKNPEEFSRMRCEQMKAVVADPEWRRKNAANLAANNAAMAADPERREKHAARMEELKQDPEYQRVQRENGKVLSDPVIRRKWIEGMEKAITETNPTSDRVQKWVDGMKKAVSRERSSNGS
jgi:hypothetical protein